MSFRRILEHFGIAGKSVARDARNEQKGETRGVRKAVAGLAVVALLGVAAVANAWDVLVHDECGNSVNLHENDNIQPFAVPARIAGCYATRDGSVPSLWAHNARPAPSQVYVVAPPPVVFVQPGIVFGPGIGVYFGPGRPYWGGGYRGYYGRGWHR